MTERKARILIVDDDQRIRAAIANALNHLNYECATAPDADNASESLTRSHFDLVLLDIDMPGKSGMELLHEITGLHPELAVVMLSGNEQVETAVAAMREEASDYLTKPVGLSELQVRLERALSRRDLILENRDNQRKLRQMVDKLKGGG